MIKALKSSLKALAFFGMGLFVSQIITNGSNKVFIGGLIMCFLILAVSYLIEE